jgi:hypothetical protein
MKRWLLVCITTLMLLGAVTAGLLGVAPTTPTVAAPGPPTPTPTPVPPGAERNASNAARCANGGYLELTRTDGTPFENAGQCTSYAARGGTLVSADIDLDVVDAGIDAGTGQRAWYVTGTGFTPNTVLTVLNWTFPSGEVAPLLESEGGVLVGPTGAFTTQFAYLLCSRGTNSVQITATDAAGASRTETIVLDCGV